MRADRHNARNSSARWEIILGVLFVVSFLGVTLALTISNAVAAPNASDYGIDANIPSESPIRDDVWRIE